jgi:zinc transport system substrate-binding protein
MILMKHSAVLLVAGVLALSGCTITPPSTDQFTVVVGLYPYAYLAQAIGGERVVVTNLTPPGAEPHDLELTARQIVEMTNANLVIYQSGLQPAVDAAIEQSTPVRTLDMATVVALDNGGTDHEDPHIWLDPTLMILVGQAIAQQMIAADPEGEATYTQGLARLKSALTNLDDQFQTGLSSCERSEFVTAHAAFGYLAKRYGLVQIPISGLSPDAEPSPDRIAEIHALALELGLTTIFFETLTSSAVVDIIAADLGMVTDVLDPVEGITTQSRGNDYVEIMSANLVALQRANGCT